MAAQAGPRALKLCFLIDSMRDRGGMERVTASVAGGLSELGFDVQVLCLRGESSAFELPAGVTLSTLRLPEGPLRMRGETAPLMRALRRELRRRRPDVLITVDTFLSVFAFPVTLGLGIRRLAWEHFNFHTDLGMRSRRLGRWASAHLGHGVLTLTDRDAQEWRRAYPRRRARVVTLPNPLSFPAPLDNPYGLHSRTVLAMGRLDGQKGFDLLLAAWARVEAAHPEWQLRLFGQGADEADLRRQAGTLGLRRWELLPPTPEVERQFREAGVYCLSSRHEGLPMVLMESQSYGVPAVAFDCPTGPAELLASGGGQLVPPGDLDAFALALAGLLGDSGQRSAMSGRAFSGARQYGAPQVLQRWADLLRSSA